jgi:hypothetical protein
MACRQTLEEEPGHKIDTLPVTRPGYAPGGKIQGIGADAQAAAQEVWTNNHGRAIDAFKTKWEHQNSPAAVLKDGAIAAYSLGAALFICAIVVLVLKINVIVQLRRTADDVAKDAAQTGLRKSTQAVEKDVAEDLAKKQGAGDLIKNGQEYKGKPGRGGGNLPPQVKYSSGRRKPCAPHFLRRFHERQ